MQKADNPLTINLTNSPQNHEFTVWKKASSFPTQWTW